MAYDLRFEGWIPFRRADGKIEWGPPSRLTVAIETNPIVALATPRPDFNGALTEFLVGLFSVALRVEDEDAWLELWRKPPTPDALAKALATLPAAFDLDGDGARFLQDLAAGDFADDKTISDIEALLIDAAGGQTAKLNKDLFVKRDRVAALGRPAAAMALITLQTYAPSGGQGHRTSMRGGGPLTTLIEPRVNRDGQSQADRQPLWFKIWANAETVEQWEARGPDTADAGDTLIFPWLAPTHTSDSKNKGKPTTMQDGHPLQVYFGMPRRIRLDFTAAKGVCDLIGRGDEVTVKHYRARNYGVEYDRWRHPLTPYRDKKMQHLPVHGQSDGICWRDWAGLLFSNADEGGQPALAVSHFMVRRARKVEVFKPRLHAFGYDMDNMKARGWIDAELPVFVFDPKQAEIIAQAAERLTEAARVAAEILLFSVKSARFKNPKEVKGDFAPIKAQVWARSEEVFYQTIKFIIDGAETVETLRGFLKPLSEIATALFDELCPMEGLEFADARRLIAAKYGFGSALRGYGAMGKKLFEALACDLPEKKSKAKKKDAAA